MEVSKKVESRTLLLWCLALMLIFQAMIFAILKIKVESSYRESEIRREQLSKEVLRMIDSELENKNNVGGNKR